MPRKPAKQKVLDPTLPIYQVEISLRHTEPLIWRRVQIDDCSLDELHEIIQATMGWQDMHMYAFVVEGEEFGNPKRGSESEYDSRLVRLSEVVDEGHTRFRYDYDFGDNWEHVIDVEKTLPAEAGVRYPRCVKGERPCPPEDCGGPRGYAELLEKIYDPEHEEHDDALEWVGNDFDPDEFDLDAVNDELRHLRRWLGKRKGCQSLRHESRQYRLPARRRRGLPGRRRLSPLPVVEEQTGERGRRMKAHGNRPHRQGA